MRKLLLFLKGAGLTVVSLLCMQASLFAQRTVSGTVSDADGTLPGVNVVVKGSATGVLSGADGKYSISVPNNDAVLVFSSLGYASQEVKVGTRTVIDVLLNETAEDLDEIIVVAYGTAKKSSFTGSATTVKAAEIGKIQTSNVTNALVGKVTGMQMTSGSGQPGSSSPGIRVRGITSINAGNDPLIVLDGVPYSGDMNNINSMDVETMTVLKDAASTALYGARGANGVILVTTKKGAKGEARVTFDSRWGANSRSTQDYNYITSPAQYYEMYYGALYGYLSAATSDKGLGYSPEQAHIIANQNMTGPGDYGLGYNVYTVPAGQYLIGANGKLNPSATLGNVVTYNGQEYTLMPDNWLDYAYKQSLRQEYNVTISSGNDKSSFFASVGYLDNNGITAKSDYKRLVSRLKADYQVKPWMKVGANMSYTRYTANSLGEDGVSNSSGNVFAVATQVAPIYPLFIRDGQGNIMKDSNGLTMYDYGDKKNAGLSRPSYPNTNAISDVLLDTRYNEGNAFSASGTVDIDFLKYFKFTSVNSAIVDEARFTYITNPYYGQYATSNGIVTLEHLRRFQYNTQQLLSFTYDIESHHLSALLGHEAYRNKYYTLYADKSNMFDPNNHELNGAINDGSQGSYTTDYNTEGFFFRGQYDYDNKYFGSVSFRRDATSRFHPDNRWGNFWSAGAAWVLSRESWLSDVSWIDLLKLKASYGERGNDNIGNYLYTNTYSLVNSMGRPAAVPNSTRGNKDITWETVGDFNSGVEFNLFENRLIGSVEYYYRKTSDMLYAFTIPPALGFTNYYANIGDMRNTGIEIELKGTVVKTKNLSVELNLNATHNSNKIIRLPEERKTTTTSEGVQGYASGNYFIGEGIPLYTFYMANYAGVNDKGESLFYKDKKENDEVVGRETTTNYSEMTSYLSGSAMPDWYGGFGTRIDFFGFDFSIDFAYQIGGLAYDGTYALAMDSPVASSKGGSFHADLLNSWTAANPTDQPRFRFGDTYTAATSDRFLTDASYLTIQNISFGYTLPSRVCKKFSVENLRLYLACDNVWLWSKRQGLDPRYNFSGGVNNTIYAPIRTISGGLSLTF
jgi:TonB-linked SusC/RagA family outer membrane protein